MPDYGSFTKVLVTQDDRLLTVSLNNPDRLNAMGGGLERELSEVLRLVAADESVGAVLLRGEGRAFCAGGDVKSFNEQTTAAEQPPPASRVLGTLKATEILDTILAVPQPIVAAVHGYAMGLGATIALFCDVVVAAEDAKIADSHVAVGLVAGDGGAVAWPLLMPLGAARYHLLTGEPLTGADAARYGMVLRAVPAADLAAESERVARKLADGAPLAVQGTKATLNKIVRERMALTLESGLLLEGATFVSDDHKEAAAAFVEKRKPKFQGR
ncbi:enoyl-CoA hydratase/isomerase family protein [Actinomadura syzygii]|nr:enoyl-CoA hydratase-related protein [Actinomadura syzygii]